MLKLVVAMVVLSPTIRMHSIKAIHTTNPTVNTMEPLAKTDTNSSMATHENLSLNEL